MKLMFFLADLMRDPELQDEFTRQPARVMKKAGLTAAQIKLLKSRNQSEISQAVAHELMNPMPLAPAPWPSAELDTISSVTPSQGRQGETELVEIVVLQSSGTPLSSFGKSRAASRKDEIKYVATLTQGRTKIQGEVTNIRLAYPKATFSVKYPIPDNAPVGLYDVNVGIEGKVVNGPKMFEVVAAKPAGRRKTTRARRRA